MEIVSWKPGVNRIITNETSVTVGTNAVQNDTAENGVEQSFLRSSGVPDQYSVNMIFSNSNKDSFYENHTLNGKHITEWQAFLDWFKHDTAMGTKPFYFSSIGDVSGETKSVYRIMSNGMPKGQPNGQYMKCSMTWQEVILETMTYEQKNIVGDYLDVTNGAIEYHFNEVPSVTVRKSDFTITVEKDGVLDNSAVVEELDYDGYKTCVLYHQSFAESGTYLIQVQYKNTTPVSKYLIVQES